SPDDYFVGGVCGGFGLPNRISARAANFSYSSTIFIMVRLDSESCICSARTRISSARSRQCWGSFMLDTCPSVPQLPCSAYHLFPNGARPSPATASRRGDTEIGRGPSSHSLAAFV